MLDVAIANMWMAPLARLSHGNRRHHHPAGGPYACDHARMGMVWEARALDANEVTHLRDDPDAIWELIESDVDFDSPESTGASDASVDLDKSWHGLHWLLTGTADSGEGPLADVILGGDDFGGDEENGPPRLLDPGRVAAASAALAPIGPDELRRRFDPVAMAQAEIYPEIWGEPGVLDDYVVPSYESLKAFYSAAAARGDWVLHLLT